VSFPSKNSKTHTLNTRKEFRASTWLANNTFLFVGTRQHKQKRKSRAESDLPSHSSRKRERIVSVEMGNRASIASSRKSNGNTYQRQQNDQSHQLQQQQLQQQQQQTEQHLIEIAKELKLLNKHFEEMKEILRERSMTETAERKREGGLIFGDDARVEKRSDVEEDEERRGDGSETKCGTSVNNHDSYPGNEKAGEEISMSEQEEELLPPANEKAEEQKQKGEETRITQGAAGETTVNPLCSKVEAEITAEEQKQPFRFGSPETGDAPGFRFGTTAIKPSEFTKFPAAGGTPFVSSGTPSSAATTQKSGEDSSGVGGGSSSPFAPPRKGDAPGFRFGTTAIKPSEFTKFAAGGMPFVSSGTPSSAATTQKSGEDSSGVGGGSSSPFAPPRTVTVNNAWAWQHPPRRNILSRGRRR
jgi:hypothetical protein